VPCGAGAGHRAGNATGLARRSLVQVEGRAGVLPCRARRNYDEFGSGITVPGYGFVLHNRGSLFTLDPKSPNVIAPHKRPFNTLSAGFLIGRHGALPTQ
jgi:gamma-glutamyltranspeptidase / glutathione hydrolase